MFENQINKSNILDTTDSKKGFNSALYLSPPKFNEFSIETPVKNDNFKSEYGKVSFNSELMMTPSENSNQNTASKNCISKDLLQKLEEDPSPIKQRLFGEKKLIFESEDKNLSNEKKDQEDIKEFENVYKDIVEKDVYHRKPLKDITNTYYQKTKEEKKPINVNPNKSISFLDKLNLADSNTATIIKNSCINVTNVNIEKLEIMENLKKEKSGERKLEEIHKGGWVCPCCKNFNYEKRKKCNKCHKLNNKFQMTGSASTKESSKKSMKSNSDSVELTEENPKNVLEENSDDPNSQKKKKLTERVGDWVCVKCKNLNFSFRIICNRCEMSKVESDSIQNHYNSATNYAKLTELVHKQQMINNYIHQTRIMGNINGINYGGFDMCNGFVNNLGVPKFFGQNQIPNNFGNFQTMNWNNQQKKTNSGNKNDYQNV